MKENNDYVGLEVKEDEKIPEKNQDVPRKKKKLNRLRPNNQIDNKNNDKYSTSLANTGNYSESLQTGIFLDIQGVIKEGTFPEGDQIFCKYDIIYGDEWKVISGQSSGQSQHACLGEGSTCYFVWNMPFQMRLYSEKPSNWPQIIISCYYPDFLGREILKAYGTCYIPTTNGQHERNISMFCPISSYSFTKILEIMYGEKAELINAPKILALGDGREILRTKSEGNIILKFHINLENMEANGFEI